MDMLAWFDWIEKRMEKKIRGKKYTEQSVIKKLFCKK
jgi:hypothetical protein